MTNHSSSYSPSSSYSGKNRSGIAHEGFMSGSVVAHETSSIGAGIVEGDGWGGFWCFAQPVRHP